MMVGSPRKAFIFDMDGVLIDTERTWVTQGSDFLPNLLGKDVMSAIGSTLGMSSDTVIKKARALGVSISDEEYNTLLDAKAEEIYGMASMTEGIDRLGATLHAHGYMLAIVTASRREWVNFMIPRLSFAHHLDLILSLAEREDLAHKPSPDGYLEAMRQLNVLPTDTIILEDSNQGIRSGKAAGAFVIGLRTNLVAGYQQTGADRYADTIDEVRQYIDSLNT